MGRWRSRDYSSMLARAKVNNLIGLFEHRPQPRCVRHRCPMIVWRVDSQNLWSVGCLEHGSELLESSPVSQGRVHPHELSLQEGQATYSMVGLRSGCHHHPTFLSFITNFAQMGHYSLQCVRQENQPERD